MLIADLFFFWEETYFFTRDTINVFSTPPTGLPSTKMGMTDLVSAPHRNFLNLKQIFLRYSLQLRKYPSYKESNEYTYYVTMKVNVNSDHQWIHRSSQEF